MAFKTKEEAREYNRAWAARNRERRRAASRACYQKDSSLAKNRARRYRRENPEKVKDAARRKSKKIYAESPYRFRAFASEWKKANPERYREIKRLSEFKRRFKREALNDGTITPEFLKALYAERFCFYCEFPVKKSKRTLDHKIPLSRDGWHSSDNAVMACRSCNERKRDKTDSEFMCEAA